MPRGRQGNRRRGGNTGAPHHKHQVKNSTYSNLCLSRFLSGAPANPYAWASALAMASRLIAPRRRRQRRSRSSRPARATGVLRRKGPQEKVSRKSWRMSPVGRVGIRWGYSELRLLALLRAGFRSIHRLKASSTLAFARTSPPSRPVDGANLHRQIRDRAERFAGLIPKARARQPVRTMKSRASAPALSRQARNAPALAYPRPAIDTFRPSVSPLDSVSAPVVSATFRWPNPFLPRSWTPWIRQSVPWLPWWLRQDRSAIRRQSPPHSRLRRARQQSIRDRGQKRHGGMQSFVERLAAKLGHSGLARPKGHLRKGFAARPTGKAQAEQGRPIDDAVAAPARDHAMNAGQASQAGDAEMGISATNRTRPRRTYRNFLRNAPNLKPMGRRPGA